MKFVFRSLRDASFASTPLFNLLPEIYSPILTTKNRSMAATLLMFESVFMFILGNTAFFDLESIRQVPCMYSADELCNHDSIFGVVCWNISVGDCP